MATYFRNYSLSFVRRAGLLLVILGLSQIVTAQEIQFEYITSDVGLSHSSVTSIVQDNEGFMWFGTMNGLNRYDGYNFVKYYHDPKDTTTIVGDQIEDLLVDSKGVLWIGTNNGLSRYDREMGSFVNYFHKPADAQSYGGGSASCLFEDSQGRLWIGSIGGGINLYKPETDNFQHFVHDPSNSQSLSENNIRGIAEDSDGGLWFGTENTGINHFIADSQSFTNYSHDSSDSTSLPHNSIYALVNDSEGNIWIGTLGAGLVQMSTGQNGEKYFISRRPDTEDARRLKVLSLRASKNNGIWIGTENGGLDFYDINQQNFTNYQYNESNPGSINNNSIHAVFEDKSNNLWVGTYAGGINVYKKNQKAISTYRRIPGNENSISYNAVSCFYEDPQGLIWIGTDGGGLNAWDRENQMMAHYNSGNSSIQSDAILAICPDADNNIWVGGWEAAFSKYLNDGSFYTLTQDKGIPNNNIFDMERDSHGDLWATFGGIGFGRFFPESETFEMFTADNLDLPSPWILDIEDDGKGNLLLAHSGGFSVFSIESLNLTNYTFNESDTTSISQNQINTILVTNDGDIWVGTVNGLNQFLPNQKKFTRYYERDGLPNNNIAGLVEDQHGNIWISTGNGISRFDPSQKTFNNFGLTDGLQGKSFIRNSAYKTSADEILFGGTNGFNIFHPDSLHDNPFTPSIVITAFSIFNKPVQPGDRNSPLEVDISQTTEIELSYAQSVFSFDFVALDYTAPEQNQYAYMLEGFDEEWVYVEHKRFASYTNIDPGEYIFRVKGSNNDGLWNEEGRSIKIEIIPPFWRTWYFYTLVVLVIMGIVYLFVKWREKKLKEDKMILQQKIDEEKARVLKIEEEIRQRDEAEKDQRWHDKGIALFSDIISKNKDDIGKLGGSVLKQLISYLNSVQASIFILNDDNPDDLHLEVIATYAAGENRALNMRVELDVGLVGTCFKEGKVNYITNLPDNYARISSGLGESSPKYLALIPLELDEIMMGVIEILSFHPFEDKHIGFVQKLGENISSNLYILKASRRTKDLLEQAHVQEEELRAQEEEMRQNMEELQATQEDFHRREKEYKKKISTLEGK